MVPGTPPSADHAAACGPGLPGPQVGNGADGGRRNGRRQRGGNGDEAGCAEQGEHRCRHRRTANAEQASAQPGAGAGQNNKRAPHQVRHRSLRARPMPVGAFSGRAPCSSLIDPGPSPPASCHGSEHQHQPALS